MSGAPIAPGLSLTLYPGDDPRALAASLPLLEEARPEVVQLHTAPGPNSGRLVEQLRARLPGVRVWLGIPANPLVRETGRATARRFARTARELGAEAMILNCERPSKAGWSGWSTGSLGLTAATLADRMTAMLEGAAEGADGRLVLGFTSHDLPEGHPIPWRQALGPGSPVRLHLPQQYPAPTRKRGQPPPTPTSRRAAIARATKSDAQWAEQVARGVVRPDLAPGGEGFVVYTQLHDIELAGICALLDRTPLAAAWALDTQTGDARRERHPRCDDVGARAVRVVAAVRREAGPAPGAVARWQAARGLVADGIVGAKTLAALGL